MITIIITSYDEVKATTNAVQAILDQEIPDTYRIVIAEPFEDNIWELQETFKNHPDIEYYQDEGKGKSHTLNHLIKKYYTTSPLDLFIFTDGDVYLGDRAIQELYNVFEDKTIGVVCGKPTSLNSRNTMLGYWSHLFFAEFNKTRKQRAAFNQFFEVSGYLFAMRNGIIQSFPEHASEDNVIPSLFWKQNYFIGYAEKAHVYVKNPTTYKDWVLQKKRNIKGHMALKKTNMETSLRTSFFGEAFRGIKFVFSYPESMKELFWSITVLFARLHVWLLAFYETHFSKKQYKDGWREELTISTRTLS